MSRPRFYQRVLLVDRKMQLLFFYAAMAIGCVWAIFAVCMYAAVTSDDSGSTIAIVAGSALLMLFSTVFLGLILTNHIAGPIHRLKSEMKRVADGGEPKPLQVRNRDQMSELFAEYNRLIEKLKAS